MVIYSKTNDADDNLDFLLRRSIDLIEREKAMAKKNGKKKGERATISRERRLALALRAVLDAIDVDGDSSNKELMHEAMAATDTLSDLNYGSLVGIPKRLKELNEQLKAAVDAGDGKEISRLGLLIDRVKMGKDVETPKAAAAGGE